jgi:hypothetical protein
VLGLVALVIEGEINGDGGPKHGAGVITLGDRPVADDRFRRGRSGCGCGCRGGGGRGRHCS